MAVAERLGNERPEWELAAGRLGHAVAHHPGAFAPKDEFAMDWYYPMLSGALEGEPGRGAHRRRLVHLRDGRARRALRVDGGLGHGCRDGRVRAGARRRSVWATRRAELFADAQRLRLPDGSYWTGMVFPDEVTFPESERTTYTAGAMVLAADALSSTTAAAGLFRGECLPAALDLAESECPLGPPGGCTAGP